MAKLPIPRGILDRTLSLAYTAEDMNNKTTISENRNNLFMIPPLITLLIS
jgi:hypothetical protein